MLQSNRYKLYTCVIKTQIKSKTQKQEGCTVSSIVLLLTLTRDHKVFIRYIISLYQKGREWSRHTQRETYTCRETYNIYNEKQDFSNEGLFFQT